MEKNLKIRYFFLLADYYWILFLKQMFQTQFLTHEISEYAVYREYYCTTMNVLIIIIISRKKFRIHNSHWKTKQLNAKLDSGSKDCKPK